MASTVRAGTVCVLGGTGFVGRTLASRLIKRGYSVRIPTRNRARHRRLLVLPDVHLIEADVHDERVLTRLTQGCDIAVNLIGTFDQHRRDGADFDRVHVDLVHKLVRACHETGVGRLLHMSALKANADRGPSRSLRSRGRGEQALRALAGEDLKYTIFRPSAIFGPDDAFINHFAALLRAMPVLALARADTRFAPVYVEDVAQAIVAALEDVRSHGQTYQLCGPEVYSLGQIVELVRAWLGLRRLVVHLPDALGRLQALAAGYLIPGARFSLDHFRSLTVAYVCTENGLEALGIRPRAMTAVVPEYLGRAGGGSVSGLRRPARR